jgi:hypothetical protein
MIEQPDQEQAEFPPPLRVNTCFDRLGIQVNGALLKLMRDHLTIREGLENPGRDTDFDRWLHGQIYTCDYNMV